MLKMCGCAIEVWNFVTAGREVQNQLFALSVCLRRMGAVSSAVTEIERSPEKVDAVIRMAWHDRTTFETIEKKTGLRENEVIQLMRRSLKRGSFKAWRKRVGSRITKHRGLLERRQRGPSDSFSHL